MPKKGFDKKSATTYQILYREQADPRIHEDGTSELVFQEIDASRSRKARDRAQLENDLFGDGSQEYLQSAKHPGDNASIRGYIRDNEGEAAEHGVYFDDTEYDYMQHLRDLGGNSEGGPAMWIDAPVAAESKGKRKVALEDALKELDLESPSSYDQRVASVAGTDASYHSNYSATTTSSKITDVSILPSTHLRHMTYQNQQDVPDELAGFQPDMDWRLREVLEALDDDAYIEDDAQDDSFFSSIAKDREEVSLAEFERIGGVLPEDEDDGWETDDTAKPTKEFAERHSADAEQSISGAALPAGDDQYGDGEFMANFRNLPKATRAAISHPKVGGSLLTASSALTAGGRHKRRKGALTNSDNYSMTSSSLARTEALSTLDARFDKTLESYMEDDEGFAGDDNSSMISGRMSNNSGLSGISKQSRVSNTSSKAPSLLGNDNFNDVMDEFLGQYSHTGKRRVIRGKPQTGMEQLDEIRKELGRPVGKATRVGR